MLNLTYRATNDREHYLGASEVPAVIFGRHNMPDAPEGMPQYLSAFDVWAKKKGFDGNTVDEASTQRGHYLEDAVFKWGCDKVEADEAVRGGDFNSPPVQGPQPHMAFHEDGWLRKSKDWYLSEVKVYRDDKGWEDDGVPAWVMAQCTYQLACCSPEVKGCYVFAYVPFKPDDVIVRFIPRNVGMEGAIMTRTAEWWSRFIIGNETPALDGSDAAGSYLTQKYGRQTTMMEDADDDTEVVLAELVAVRTELKEWTERKKVLEQRLKDRIGGREGVYSDTYGKVRWSWQKGRTTFDRKRFEQDHPELAAQYTKTGPEQRVLRLPRGK